MYKMHKAIRYKLIGLALAFCWLSFPVVAQTFTFGSDDPLIWQQVRGNAVDVGISPSGTVYVVSRTGRIWRWGSALGEEWKTMSGHGFVRVDSDSSNKPWAIDENGEVRYYNGLWWETRGKGFIDIGAGGRGAVYGLGLNGDISKWNNKTRQFDFVHARSGQRIDVDRNGHPWVVSDIGSVLAYDGEKWSELPGTVRDISVGPSGTAYAVTVEGALLRWDVAGNVWVGEKNKINATAVSVGPSGKPWVLSSEDKIYATSLFLKERVKEEALKSDGKTTPPEVPVETRTTIVHPATITDTSPIKFSLVSGFGRDIAIGADGRVFIVRSASSSLGLYSNSRKAFLDFPGELSRLAASLDGSLWGVNNKQEVYHHDGQDWDQVLGVDGVDIATGFGGEVFATDDDEIIYKYDEGKNRFRRYPGIKGSRIAVDVKGNPWVINSAGVIRRCDVDPCKRTAHIGQDIAIGPDGSVLLVDDAGKIYIFDRETTKWVMVRGVKFSATSVAVGPNGRPWAIADDGQVYSSAFFERDEKKDNLIANQTNVRTTSSTQSIFTFTKNIKFEEADVSDLGGIDFLDLAIGADGTIIAIESTFDGNPPQKVVEYNQRTNKFEEADDQPTVFANSVAVDPDGEMWIINTTTADVYEQKGSSFKKRTGLVSGGGREPDIAIGADGTIFALDTNGSVYKYNTGSKKFKQFVSSGTYDKISVSAFGVPWVVDSNNIIYRYDGDSFEKLSGVSDKAVDIGIGADGSVFIAAKDTGDLKRWNDSNQDFDDLSNGQGNRLTVSPEGRPWYIKFGDTTKIFIPKN